MSDPYFASVCVFACRHVRVRATLAKPDPKLDKASGFVRQGLGSGRLTFTHSPDELPASDPSLRVSGKRALETTGVAVADSGHQRLSRFSTDVGTEGAWLTSR